MIPRDYLESLPITINDEINFGDRVSAPFFNNGRWYYRLRNQTFPLVVIIDLFTYNFGAVVTGGIFEVSHSINNFNPETDSYLLNVFLKNLEADHGFLPGEIIKINDGFTPVISNTDLQILISNQGIKIISKAQQKSRNINPIKWTMFIKLIKYDN